MDFDIRTIMYIADLIGNIKKTYKSFSSKEKPRYYNRPQYNQFRRMSQRRSFWI